LKSTLTPTAPGTRPAGVTADQAARHVRGMFDEIAPTYDRLNHLLSLSVDRYWRRRTVRAVRQRLGVRQDSRPILDVCCGTGDLTLALHAGLGEGVEVLGADFSGVMLSRAQAKAPELGWLQADGLHLPFADGSFAAIATAFGFRNLADYRAGLSEFRRLLQPGGVVAILEVARPTVPVLGPLYRFYFERVLPRLGGWISGHPEAYRYLPSSVSRFPAPPELAVWMREAQFRAVEYERLSGGIATLHLGIRP